MGALSVRAESRKDEDEDEEGREEEEKDNGREEEAKGTFPRDKIRLLLSAPFHDTGLEASRGSL